MLTLKYSFGFVSVEGTHYYRNCSSKRKLSKEEVTKISNNYIKKIEDKYNTNIVSWTTLSH
jgi:hypothetical protein